MVKKFRYVVTAAVVACGAVVGTLAVSSCGQRTDPYNEFLASDGAKVWRAENGDHMISREDAQARAWLACSMKLEPAPGTVDFYLLQAYDLC